MYDYRARKYYSKSIRNINVYFSIQKKLFINKMIKNNVFHVL